MFFTLRQSRNDLMAFQFKCADIPVIIRLHFYYNFLKKNFSEILISRPMPYNLLPVPWFSLAFEVHYFFIYYSFLFLYVLSEIFAGYTDISDIYS